MEELLVLSPKTDTCETCKFWELIDDEHKEGYCHCSSPHPTLGSRGDVINYPITRYFDWCGEFVKE